MATGANDPLHARCLVLDDGDVTLAMVVCDSCAIPRTLMDDAKRQASAATGIPTGRIMISATHTHEAPTSTSAFQSDPDPDYVKFLAKKIAEGIETAWKRREPAKIGWGSGKDGSQVFNRRWFTKPGVSNEDPFGGTADVVRMNPGFSKDVLSKQAGGIDPEVGVISVRSIDDRPIAVWANYSLHYVGDVPATLMSADYYGVFAERIAARVGGSSTASPPFVGMMTNATSGDINNIDFGGGPRPPRGPLEQSNVVATIVADAAYKALEKMTYQTWVSLAAVQVETEFDVRMPSEADLKYAQARLEKAGPGPYGDIHDIYARETIQLAKYPPQVKSILQAFRIGEMAIVSSPCETFVETGLAIKAASPFKPTFVVELANGYNGYLPTPEQHKLGGYETWRARSSYLSTDAEPKLRSTLLDLLNQLQRQPHLDGGK
jgi:hypothetical protein